MPDRGVNTVSGQGSTRWCKPDTRYHHPALPYGYQDTSNWFIRRMNWFGSSSVPRSANSA